VLEFHQPLGNARLQSDVTDSVHPLVNSGCKPEPLDYLTLAAFDIKVDRKSKFRVLLLAIATVCQTNC
jgi:hypothetical protein